MQHASDLRPGLRVLLVGDGGREHALAWKLAQSPLLGSLLAAPGNPGIAEHATCFAIPADDVAGIVALAVEQRVDFVVVGPEDPLAAGLVDALTDRGILTFGPTQAAARLVEQQGLRAQLDDPARLVPDRRRRASPLRSIRPRWTTFGNWGNCPS